MLKKYFKQILGEFKEEKLHNNFYDTIIDIDWKKINYNRSAFINKALHKFHNGKYLEIGCNNNKCFNSIFAKFKVGVDPNLGGTIRDTSDNFFNNNTMFFDVIFIDGLHTFEQCRKDIINSLKFIKQSK